MTQNSNTFPPVVSSHSLDSVNHRQLYGEEALCSCLALADSTDYFFNPVANGLTGYAFDGFFYQNGVKLNNVRASWALEGEGDFRGGDVQFPTKALIAVTDAGLSILDCNQVLKTWMIFARADKWAFTDACVPAICSFTPSAVAYANGLISLTLAPDVGSKYKRPVILHMDFIHDLIYVDTITMDPGRWGISTVSIAEVGSTHLVAVPTYPGNTYAWNATHATINQDYALSSKTYFTAGAAPGPAVISCVVETDLGLVATQYASVAIVEVPAPVLTPLHTQMYISDPPNSISVNTQIGVSHEWTIENGTFTGTDTSDPTKETRLFTPTAAGPVIIRCRAYNALGTTVTVSRTITATVAPVPFISAFAPSAASPIASNQPVTTTPIFNHGTGVLTIEILNYTGTQLDPIDVLSGDTIDLSAEFMIDRVVWYTGNHEARVRHTAPLDKSVQYTLTVTGVTGAQVTSTFTLDPLTLHITSFSVDKPSAYNGDDLSFTATFENGTGAFLPNQINAVAVPITSGVPVAAIASLTSPYEDFRLTVANVWGAQLTQTLRVPLANGAPVITTQPLAPTQQGHLGDTTTLTVAVSGPGPFTYQWSSDSDINLLNTTSSSLVLPLTTNVQHVYATVTNRYGQATTVLVEVPPAITHYIPPPMWLQTEVAGGFNTGELVETNWDASITDPSTIFGTGGATSLACDSNGDLYYYDRWTTPVPSINKLNRTTGTITRIPDGGWGSWWNTGFVGPWDSGHILSVVPVGSYLLAVVSINGQTLLDFLRINLDGSYAVLQQGYEPVNDIGVQYQGHNLTFDGNSKCYFVLNNTVQCFDLNAHTASEYIHTTQLDAALPDISSVQRQIMAVAIIGTHLYIYYIRKNGVVASPNYQQQEAWLVSVDLTDLAKQLTPINLNLGPNDNLVEHMVGAGDKLYVSRAKWGIASLSLTGTLTQLMPFDPTTNSGWHTQGEPFYSMNTPVDGIAYDSASTDVYYCVRNGPIFRMYYGPPADVFHFVLETKNSGNGIPIIPGQQAVDWCFDDTCQFSKYNPLCRAKRISFNGIKADQYSTAIEYYFEAWVLDQHATLDRSNLILRLEDQDGNLLLEIPSWPNNDAWFEMYLPYTGLYHMEVSTITPYEAARYDQKGAFEFYVQSWDNGTLDRAWGPSIIEQPASIGATLGDPVSFTVRANGTFPLQYQWKKNGQAISGANSRTLTTTAQNFVDVFTCDVSNPGGTATSDGASVLPPGRPAPPTWQNELYAGQTGWSEVDAYGPEAGFNYVNAMAVHANGDLYVADGDSFPEISIRKIDYTTRNVTTIAGRKRSYKNITPIDYNNGMMMDGQGINTIFGPIHELCFGPDGYLYILQTQLYGSNAGNLAIVRRMDLAGNTQTLMADGTFATVQTSSVTVGPYMDFGHWSNVNEFRNAAGQSSDSGSMAWGPDGKLYVHNGVQLRRWTPGATSNEILIDGDMNYPSSDHFMSGTGSAVKVAYAADMTFTSNGDLLFLNTDNQSQVLTGLYKYDLGTQTMTHLADLPQGSGCVREYNGKLIILNSRYNNAVLYEANLDGTNLRQFAPNLLNNRNTHNTGYCYNYNVYGYGQLEVGLNGVYHATGGAWEIRRYWYGSAPDESFWPIPVTDFKSITQYSSNYFGWTLDDTCEESHHYPGRPCKRIRIKADFDCPAIITYYKTYNSSTLSMIMTVEDGIGNVLLTDNTGTINWNPPVKGAEYVLEVTTAGPFFVGRYAPNGTFEIQITADYAGATSPQITVQPVNATASNGLATFSVEATGTAPLRYKWQRAYGQYQDIWLDIDGATSSTASIPTTGVTPTDLFRVVVYNYSNSRVSNTVSISHGLSSPANTVSLYQTQSTTPSFWSQPLLWDTDGYWRVFHVDTNSNLSCQDLQTGSETTMAFGGGWDQTQTRVQKFGDSIFFVSQWHHYGYYMQFDAVSLGSIKFSNTVDPFGATIAATPALSAVSWYKSSMFMRDDHTIVAWYSRARNQKYLLMFFDINTEQVTYTHVPDCGCWGENIRGLYNDQDLPLITRQDGTYDVGWLFATDNSLPQGAGYSDAFFHLAYSVSATNTVVATTIPSPGGISSYCINNEKYFQAKVSDQYALLLYWANGNMNFARYSISGGTWDILWTRSAPSPSNHGNASRIQDIYPYMSSIVEVGSDYYITGFRPDGTEDWNAVTKITPGGSATQVGHIINTTLGTPSTYTSNPSLINNDTPNYVSDTGDPLPVKQVHLPHVTSAGTYFVSGSYSGVDSVALIKSEAGKPVLLFHAT